MQILLPLFYRKLQEVKDRLNQLRSLVQYYQTSAEQGVVPEIDERTAFQNMIEEYNQGLSPNRYGYYQGLLKDIGTIKFCWFFQASAFYKM